MHPLQEANPALYAALLDEDFYDEMLSYAKAKWKFLEKQGGYAPRELVEEAMNRIADGRREGTWVRTEEPPRALVIQTIKSIGYHQYIDKLKVIGSLEFQVGNFLALVVSDKLTDEQRQNICNTINAIFGNTIATQLIPESVSTANELLINAIVNQYPTESDKMMEFLKDIKAKIGNNNPIKNYKSEVNLLSVESIEENIETEDIANTSTNEILDCFIIDCLPKGIMQEIAIMKFIDCLSQGDIAIKIGKSDGYVSGIMQQILPRLKEYLIEIIKHNR